MATDLPNLPEASSTGGAELPTSPPDIESVRSASSSRPPPPPKENRVSRASLLQVVQTNTDLLVPENDAVQNRRRKYHPFWNQLAQIKHWFKESTKKAKSPINSGIRSAVHKPAHNVPATHSRRVSRISNSSTSRYSNSHVRPEFQRNHSGSNMPAIGASGTGSKRLSLSPSPLTPRSSTYRRSSGLRGRKSTSSSVSSIRSIHHQHSLSKASSTSSASASLASPTGSVTVKVARSPHTSVKVLPATPTNSSFPSSARVMRKPLSISTESAAAFSMLPPSSPGIMFAKRKRSPFKGPMLSLSTGFGSTGKGRTESLSRSSSVQRKRSSELAIQEEDEDEDEDGVEV